MESETIEAEITELERTMEPVRRNLDSCIEAFAGEIPAHAAQWIRTETERQVQRSAGRLTEADRPRLHALKEELVALTGRLPQIARSAITPPERWPHNLPLARDGRSRDLVHQYFSDAYRTVVSQLGAALARARFLPERGREHHWESAGEGNYRYRHGTGFDDLRIPSVQEYERLYGQFQELLIRLESKRGALVEERARELWESA